MKRLAGILVVTAAVAVAAQEPDAWQHWRYSAPIETSSPSVDGLVSAWVPPYVTEHAARGWSDLRVIDSRGAEQPFILHARTGHRQVDRRPVPLLEPSRVEGQYQQALIDTGGDVLHNSLRLGIVATRSLLTRVEIAVSTDLVDWRVVREDAPIYVLLADGMGQNTDVIYPDSVSRYVRIRVLDGSATYTLESAEIGVERSVFAQRLPVDVMSTSSTRSSGETVWTSDRDMSHVPISRVDFSGVEGPFARPVTVEVNDGGRRWRQIAAGEVLTMSQESGGRAWLSIDVPEQYARGWRVIVDNRNDAPVQGLRPVLMATPRHVVFRADAGESYRLLYGHPKADAPRYDLARLIDTRDVDAAQSVTVGEPIENLAWVDPSPWTERYDLILWLALFVAVAAIGTVALRTLRAAGAR